MSEENLPATASLFSSAAPTLDMILFLCVFFAQMFRDPRFDDLSGEYKPEIFEKTFKFINDIKHREKEVRGVQIGLI